MTIHSSELEKYNGSKSRHTCPGCGKPKCFSRYINKATGEYYANHVGKCNREVKCSYHYTPKQFYIDNPTLQEDERCSLQNTKGKATSNAVKTVHFIPFDIVEATKKEYLLNTFVQNLIKTIPETEVFRLVNEYHLGTVTGSYMRGAVTFPFIDIMGNCRAIQAKTFDAENHTLHTNHLHALLKGYLEQQNKPMPLWLQYYLQNESKFTCLFGEHLLKAFPDKPVAICEAPKTAIVASCYLPKFLWLAVGAKGYLTKDRMKVLHGRHVVLWPDLNAFNDWQMKAEEMRDIFASIKVSSLLERKATSEERAKGLDIADYLVRFPVNDFNKPPRQVTDEELMKQFNEWIKSNPEGGIFEYQGGKLMVKPREVVTHKS